MFSFPSGFVSLSDAWLVVFVCVGAYIPINRFKVTLGRFENSCLPVLSQYHMYKQRKNVRLKDTTQCLPILDDAICDTFRNSAFIRIQSNEMTHALCYTSENVCLSNRRPFDCEFNTLPLGYRCCACNWSSRMYWSKGHFMKWITSHICVSLVFIVMHM